MPPVETPPAAAPAAAPPAPKPTTNNDPFLARILDDMGKAVSDGQVVDAPAKAPEAPRNVLDGEFISMGEHARFKKEREESKAAAAKPADAPAADDAAKKDDAAPAPKAEAKPDEAKPDAAPAAPTAPPAAKPKVVVEKAKPIEEIVEGVVRKLAQDKPAPPPPPVTAPKKEEQPDPDAAYIEGLDSRQKKALEIARFAATAEPDKYANLPKRTIDYFKKVETYIQDKLKDDPDWNAEEDGEFEAWIDENKPIADEERERLNEARIEARVTEKVESKFKPQLEETQRTARVQELKPEIDKAAQSYVGAVAKRFAPDEKSPFAGVLKVVEEKGWTDEAWKEARAVDPIAATTAQNYMGQANVMGREYLELVAGTSQQVAYRPDQPPTSATNQKAILQQRLFGFIEQQEQIFAREAPEDMRVIKGKSFVTRRELEAMPPAEQARHWTLGHDDILDMISVAASAQAQQALAAEVKRLEEAGYVRNGKSAAPKKEDSAAPATAKREDSPKTTVTPSPGAGKLPDPTPSPHVFTEDELKRQWSGGASSWLG